MTPEDDKPLTPPEARQKLQKGLMEYLAGHDTGPIVLRPRRTKKASETYRLKLTQLQRETLLRCTQLSRNLKKKIKNAGDGTQVVSVTWNELDQLNDKTGEAVVYARNADRNAPHGRTGKSGQVLRDRTRRGFRLQSPEALEQRRLVGRSKGVTHGSREKRTD